MPRKKVSTRPVLLALRRKESNPLKKKNSIRGYYELKDVLEYVDKTAVDQISKVMLQDVCVQYGLGRKGNKASLIQRMRDHLPRLQSFFHIKESSSSDSGTPPFERVKRVNIERIEALKKERKSIVLLKKPILTLYYFLMEFLFICKGFGKKLARFVEYRKNQQSYVYGCVLFVAATVFTGILAEMSNPTVMWFGVEVLWGLYWFGLGILSSIGFGSGLGTYVMCLGPHIASVALAAYKCGTINSPESRFADQIICPEELFFEPNGISVWSIIWKVKLELLMWGIGTCTGELLSFFMARTARLSMYIVRKNTDIELLRQEQFEMESRQVLKFKVFCKLMAEFLLHNAGFFGILICAMITHPFTDFAGFICGYFLIPFSRFFGATLIGKGVIKLLIQTIAIVVACNESVTASVLNYFVDIPYVGTQLYDIIACYLLNQKHQFINTQTDLQVTILDRAFQLVFLSVMLYFVISTMNIMAQNHFKRLHVSKRRPRHIYND